MVLGFLGSHKRAKRKSKQCEIFRCHNRYSDAIVGVLFRGSIWYCLIRWNRHWTAEDRKRLFAWRVGPFRCRTRLFDRRGNRCILLKNGFELVPHAMTVLLKNSVRRELASTVRSLLGFQIKLRIRLSRWNRLPRLPVLLERCGEASASNEIKQWRRRLNKCTENAPKLANFEQTKIRMQTRLGNCHILLSIPN